MSSSIPSKNTESSAEKGVAEIVSTPAAPATSTSASTTAGSPPTSPPPPPLPLSSASPLPLASATSATTAADLRHMTSATGLSLSMSLSPTATSPNRPGRRTSQHFLRSGERGLGLGSPSSIPSSPTSIHSSSSAIFERDIEPMLPPSPPSHGKPLDPHRIPRAKNTEQLEQAVPSVLDSAAAILTSPASSTYPNPSTSPHASSSGSPPSAASPGSPNPNAFNIQDQVEVVAPVSSPGPSIFGGRTGGSASGFASPLSLRSRSPSPGPRPESLLLLNVPLSEGANTNPGVGAGSVGAVPMGRSVSTSSSFIPPTSSPPNLGFSSHPPSPLHHTQPLHHSTSQKRLSFMSYSDLLTSTPASTHTLSSLTAGQTAENPPPHIPSVSGLNLLSATASMASAASSVRGVSISPRAGSVHLGGVLGTGVVGAGSIGAGGMGGGKRESVALLDNVGGEWEREGLGRSLEDRIEREIGSAGGSVAASPVVGVKGLPVAVGNA